MRISHKTRLVNKKAALSHRFYGMYLLFQEQDAQAVGAAVAGDGGAGGGYDTALSATTRERSKVAFSGNSNSTLKYP